MGRSSPNEDADEPDDRVCCRRRHRLLLLPPPPPWLMLDPGRRRAAAGVKSVGDPAATVVAGDGVGPGVEGVVACVEPE